MELRLVGQNLTSLPEQVFDNLPPLKSLELEVDDLPSLPGEVFNSLSTLTRLDLHGEDLTSLPQGVFGNLENLTVLDLSDSGLTSLPDGVFGSLGSLEKLYLSGNNFGEYGAEGPLKLLVELEPSGSHGFLAKVREGAPFAIMIDLSVVGGSLPDASVEIAAGSVNSPDQDVTDIEASGATVSADNASFPDNLPADNYSGLSVAVSDSAGTVYIPRPVVVTLVDGPDSVSEGGTVIYTGLVEGLPTGEQIRVPYEIVAGGEDAFNHAEVDDPDDPFEPHEASDFADGTAFNGTVVVTGGPAETLTALAISITTKDDDVIDDGAQETFTVRLLPGDGYLLGTRSSWETTINEGMCDRTEGVQEAILEELGLSEDPDADCSDVTDADLASIEYFWALVDKGIEVLKPRDFIGMTGLRDIALDGNELDDLPDGLFADQSKLHLLSFDRNDITELHSDLWEGLDNLEGLIIDSNPLEGTLSADAFAGLSMMEALWIRDHGYTTLPANVFAAMPMLEDLEMGDGELETLDPATFGELDELRYIWMPANNLRVLPDDLFLGISSLEYVNFRDNPGAPFVYKVTLEPVAGEDSKVRVEMVNATPFDMTVTLSAVGGELSSYSATINAGEKASAEITVTSTNGKLVTVHMESADWDGGGMGLKLRTYGPITVTPSEG